MKITLIGTVARIGDENTYGTLRKRDLILHEGGDLSRPLPVEFTTGERGPDRILPLLALFPGDLVQVEALLTGREWEGRVYLRLAGTSVRKASFEDPAAALPPPSEPPPPQASAAENLPF